MPGEELLKRGLTALSHPKAVLRAIIDDRESALEEVGQKLEGVLKAPIVDCDEANRLDHLIEQYFTSIETIREAAPEIFKEDEIEHIERRQTSLRQGFITRCNCECLMQKVK
jgi:hypothetical protein